MAFSRCFYPKRLSHACIDFLYGWPQQESNRRFWLSKKMEHYFIGFITIMALLKVRDFTVISKTMLVTYQTTIGGDDHFLPRPRWFSVAVTECSGRQPTTRADLRTFQGYSQLLYFNLNFNNLHRIGISLELNCLDCLNGIVKTFNL